MKIFVAVSVVGLLLAGCQSEQGDVHRETQPAVRAVDRVSGNQVDPEKAVIRSYLGMTYYFESEANAQAFDSNPWTYLNDNNSRERLVAPGLQGTTVR